MLVRKITKIIAGLRNPPRKLMHSGDALRSEGH
jgi:hypothetical protein